MQNEQYTMPAMNEQERQKLIEWLTWQRDACDELHGDKCSDERCMTSKIALATLTTEPIV